MRFLIVSFICYISANESKILNYEERVEMENRLETEIDTRLPTSFKSWETLSVRVPGFQYMYHYEGDIGPLQQNIGNWEIFTERYWYETRIKNSSCPMEPSGISATCDWALMVPCLFGDVTKPPRTIFVHNLMLPHFKESTFSFMNSSWNFVLVTGGTDLTVPRQTDTRYRAHGLRGFGAADGGPYFRFIIDSPRLIHWFAENHDIIHPKLSTLPTGMSVSDPDDRSAFPHQRLPLHERPLMVMKADRIRDGRGQWADRFNVEQMCASSTFCLQPFKGQQSVEGTTHRDFMEHLLSVPFIACVHGGGIDPSPKAYESILAGTIPIIQHSTLDDAYSELPVAFVNTWEELFMSPNATEMLSKWLTDLAPYYVRGSELRWQTLEKLKTSYWVGKFYRKYWEFEEQQQQSGASSRKLTDKERLQTQEEKIAVVAGSTDHTVSQQGHQTSRNLSPDRTGGNHGRSALRKRRLRNSNSN